MKINKVNINNIDLLYKFCISNINDKFGSEINSILSHVNIFFDIDEISIFELYFLKKYINDSIIDIETYIENPFSKDDTIYTSVDAMMNLIEDINDNNDIKLKPGISLLPNACIRKHILATFNGESLLYIFSMFPDRFFKNIPYIKNFYEKYNKYPVSLLENGILNTQIKKEIDDLLISSFLNSFYSYISQKVNKFNNNIEDFISSNILSYSDNIKKVIINKITTPIGDVNFINNKKYINNEINTVKEWFNSEIFNIDYKFSNTKLYFNISSSLYTFLEMFISLPSKMFLNSTNFNLLLNENTNFIFYSIPKEYEIRISNRFNSILKEKDNISKSNKMIEKYMYIPLNTGISYILCLSLNDCQNIISNYLNEIKNGKYGNETETYFYKEIELILNKIIETSINAYKIIS